ncbi:MAG: DUF1772 domain-containing protein [Pseudomonadota bacterium]
MNLLDLLLLVSTLLCALTAGFVFAFATVVMPGIGKLDNRAFIRAFQVIDGIIQAGQPLFGLVWIGSLLALLIAAVLSVLQLEGMMRILVVAAAVSYVLGVQLPTFTINVPLNNALQSLEVDTTSDEALATARRDFEERWVRWNSIRTIVASAISLALMFVLLQS